MQNLKQSLEHQRKELNNCRAEITSLKMCIEGSRSGKSLLAGDSEHMQSESTESYKEEIKLLKQEIEILKARELASTESLESIDHDTEPIEMKDGVGFIKNNTVEQTGDVDSGVLEPEVAQLLANQTSNESSYKPEAESGGTLKNSLDDNNIGVESAENVIKHDVEPLPEDNRVLLRSKSLDSEPLPEKMVS